MSVRWILCVFLLTSSNLMAQVESWTPTGELSTGRAWHTATTLMDGSVLVAGGRAVEVSARFNSVRSVEVYSPAAGKWSDADGLNFSRWEHTSTLLLDGRVLVTGGWGLEGALASAEIFNPNTGTWTPTANLNTPRADHTATLLLDGRVLVVGGEGQSGSETSAELFDPTSGSWNTTGSMETSRAGHTATLLLDGRVLVAGGFGVAQLLSPPPGTAELYDPVAGTWSPAGNMNAARDGHTATRLTDGRVLVVGGRVEELTPSSTTEVYDPSVDEWTISGELHTPRRDHTATLLPTGQILVVAGRGAGICSFVPSSEIYEPEAGQWRLSGDLQIGRYFHTASLLLSGQVLVLGGVDRLEGQEGAGVTAELWTAHPILYPQLALGGGYEDILFVTNQGPDPWDGSLQLNGGDWPPDVEWSLDGEDQTGESTITLSLDPNETQRFILGRTGSAVSGWLEIHAESGSDLRSLATAFFYNFSSGGQLKDSTGVAPAAPQTAVRFPVERSTTANTGVAIRKTQSPIQFRLYNQSGVMVEEFTDLFEGAQFIDELFSNVPDSFTGSVELVSTQAFYVTVLRMDTTPGGFQLTSIPATPAP